MGGGNFADAKLAFNLHVLFKGRLSPYLQVIAVLFAFLLSFSSCSSDKDKEENIPQVDYKDFPKGEIIKIDNQTFMITSQADDLVLTNENWRLVLKK